MSYPSADRPYPEPQQYPDPSQPVTPPPPRYADLPAPPPSPASPSPAVQPWPPAGRDRITFREVLAGLGLAVVVALLGFPLGWLWSAVAPHATAVMTGDGAAYARPNQEQLIGAEGWYVFLTTLAGLVLAVLAWLVLRRFRGMLVLLGLGAGGVVSGVLAYWTGHRIGLTHARELIRNAPVGAHFTLPVSLRVQQVGLWHGWLPYARGDVLFLAVMAVLVYALLAGFSPYQSLRPPRAEDFSSDY